jgi:predicted transposase/invertase (TIGR01784 family)
MSYDSILKFMMEEYRQPLLQWLLNSPLEEKGELLSSELNVEPIRADGIFILEVGQKIVHLEFQTSVQSSPPLPLRMLDYWVRLYRIYEKPIEQIVIFLRKTNSAKVWSDKLELGETTHKYRVIRIWECEAGPLLEIPELLPLAVLAKSESSQPILATVAQKIDKIEDKRKQSNIAACVELLAGINFTEELIAMYLQEDILAESVIYQKILSKGRQEGRQEGLQEGRQEGEAELLIRLLNRRCGALADELQAQVRSLSIPELESLGEAILDFQGLKDLETWLQDHGQTIDK